ncbi:MAG: hypothetical protein IT165_00515 [Bryobacterales bacterium]|jgi:hypothetical protein|nr:hypothetical protein [Bryobacterales bacterium]MCC6394256.1 hypothetical protein [Bryobacterales bacterium]MCZ2150372.1 hypothetical protein [Bryobacterales bacterium]
MFDSLDETMKHDEEEQSTPRERWMKYILTLIIAVVVVGGLLTVIRMVE